MKYFAAMCALLAMILCSPLRAQDTTQESKDKDADESKSGLSVEADLTIPSSYVFRGYVVEEDHAIFQPEITLTYPHDVAGVPVSFWFNAWANLTDLSSPGDNDWFNELDLSVGADIDIGHGLSLGLTYKYYNSPADFFDDVHEVGVTLSDDCWLNPSLGVYREIHHNDGSRNNTYIEAAVMPGFDVSQIKNLHIDFPVTCGMTPDKYYTDSDGHHALFGYIMGGINATYKLTDQWSVEAGVDYIHLCADSTEASNHGEDHQVVGHVELKYEM